MHRPLQPLDRAAGCPVSAISPPGPGTHFRVAPVLRLSSASATKLRVSPNLQSFGRAGDRSSSFLESRILDAFGAAAPGCPGSCSSNCADDESPGVPESCIFPAVPAMDRRVSSSLASFRRIWR
jgi:hypothetical protein